MAMIGWVEAGIEVVDDMHAGQSQGVGRMTVDARSISRVRGNTMMTPDHTTVQVRSSG